MTPDPVTYRVVQCMTSNVGKSSVRAIASNPTLELVACYAWSPEKVGHDVGELCGIEPLNAKAANDVEVVGTAGFITGHFLRDVIASPRPANGADQPSSAAGSTPVSSNCSPACRPGKTLDDYIMLGLTITAMPAIDAIPAVVSALPGIASYTDLPLLRPRGLLRANR